jgi:uncharacterized protein YndB with AHSA1/START domain
MAAPPLDRRTARPDPARAARPPWRGAGRLLGRFLAVLVTVLLVSGLTWAAMIEGWSDTWGTTPAEAAAALPGDALIASPTLVTTRAVGVAAPPEAVWPWVVQFGQGRGGLYSYDWLEQLVGVEMDSADRILPEHQDLAVGDQVWITQPGYPADLGMQVAEVVPDRHLVLAFSTPSQPMDPHETVWTWTFVLTPDGEGGTRLLARQRNASVGAVGDVVWDRVVGPIGFAMERATVRGIAARAEAAAGQPVLWAGWETLWFAALVGCMLAVLALPFTPTPLRRVLAATAALTAAATLVLLRWTSPALALVLAGLAVALAVRWLGTGGDEAVGAAGATAGRGE